MRKSFSETLSDAIKIDEKVSLLLGDIGVGAFSSARAHSPTQILNVGILEQAMVSFGSGLALNGRKVIFHTIAPFLVGRAYDQIKVDFGYRKLPGLFVSVGASFDYGKLGSTHHCPEDVLLMGQIEGMSICCPSSGQEVNSMILNFLEKPSLTYLRLSDNLNIGQISNKEYIMKNLIKKSTGTVISVGIFSEIGKEIADQFGFHHLNLNKISSNLELPNLVEPIYIVEPYLEGSTYLIASKAFSKYTSVKSIGVPIKFHREYMNLEERYSALELDVPGIIERIRLLQNV